MRFSRTDQPYVEAAIGQLRAGNHKVRAKDLDWLLKHRNLSVGRHSSTVSVRAAGVAMRTRRGWMRATSDES
jgi:hypothetical protein